MHVHAPSLSWDDLPCTLYVPIREPSTRTSIFSQDLDLDELATPDFSKKLRMVDATVYALVTYYLHVLMHACTHKGLA